MNATCAFYTKLFLAGVAVVNVVFPWAARGFDVFLSYVSPPAQSVLYDADRFQALLVNKDLGSYQCQGQSRPTSVGKAVRVQYSEITILK